MKAICQGMRCELFVSESSVLYVRRYRAYNRLLYDYKRNLQ